MSEHEEEHDSGILHKVGHKAHKGVNLLILYELFNKLHEYWPEWSNMAKELIHAHVH